MNFTKKYNKKKQKAKWHPVRIHFPKHLHMAALLGSKGVSLPLEMQIFDIVYLGQGSTFIFMV